MKPLVIVKNAILSLDSHPDGHRIRFTLAHLAVDARTVFELHDG